ncbi:sigma-70 family RNA polymerase sigma factor [Beggiatoa alba]|nr:sigma-70 family RNA polymerase sigma factor [Beggiatoa alba]
MSKTEIHQGNSLEDLLYRCALHDANALSRLYELSSAKLFAIGLKIVSRQDIAEDVLQDSFVNIWYKAAQFRADKGSAFGWMVGIVRNKAIDWIRKNPVGRDISDDVLLKHQDPSPAADDSLADTAELQALLDCMDELEVSQRDAIATVYYQGFTHKEYSKNSGHPLGTVKSWIRRGLQALKRCLQQ